MSVVVYLVVDVSGSTVRDGFHDGVVRALPQVVAEIEEAYGDQSWLGVVTYADAAESLIPLARVSGLDRLPVPRAGGLSSMAAGLRLVAALAGKNATLVGKAIVVIVADGLPTDRDADVLAARDAVDADVHLVAPGRFPALAAAGLRATLHRTDLPSAIRTILDHSSNGLAGPSVGVSPR